MTNLAQDLSKITKGEVSDDAKTLTQFSHDASLFEIKPQVVIFPKDEEDVEAVVSYVSKNKDKHPELSLTGRSAGTDMSGGAIGDSIVVSFTKYFNKTPTVNGNIATCQSGVYYRDFEAETLKRGLIFPSYPASRELCAMGGIFNNNSGGEKSLQYGKTEKYVKRVRGVLSDGKAYDIKALDEKGLKAKIGKNDFEGKIYKKMFELIDSDYDLLKKAKPDVSKIFDLTKLWVGAQGTLGIFLEGDLELVPVHKHREMLIIFLHDMSHLGQIINEVLELKPESFESYDDNTLKLALRYFPEFAKQLGLLGTIEAGLAFFPAFFDLFTGRSLPKLVLQVDFTSNDLSEVEQKIKTLREKLKPFHPQTQIAEDSAEKRYWLVRRESFNLLRKKIRDKHTAPFIDDFDIKPEYISEVIPQITDILKKHPEFVFTVAGHVGDGNFHIIPLVDIKNPVVRQLIPQIADEVYAIIIKYKGSITAEHNDGLIRTPYVEKMFGEKVYKLFEETKRIFDPENIFNPRKKVGGSLDFAMKHLRVSW